MPATTDVPWLRAAALRRLALISEADPRTVRRVLTGKPVRGMVADRIKRAAKQGGIPVPETTGPR